MEHHPNTALAKFTSLQSTMELCEWNRRDEEVALLRELKEQDRKLQALLLKLDGTQSDYQIEAKLRNLIDYIDRETKPANMPTDDRDTFIRKVKTLNDDITTKRQAVENAITDSQTTRVAFAA